MPCKATYSDIYNLYIVCIKSHILPALTRFHGDAFSFLGLCIKEICIFNAKDWWKYIRSIIWEKNYKVHSVDIIRSIIYGKKIHAVTSIMKLSLYKLFSPCIWRRLETKQIDISIQLKRNFRRIKIHINSVYICLCMF